MLLSDTSGNTVNTCKEETWKGTLKANPGPTGTAEWEKTAFQWGGCNFPTSTTKLGKTKVEAEGEGSGIVYAAEQIKWTINTVLFGSCEYGFENGTQIGTVNSSGEFVTNAVASKLNGCVGPVTARWIGTWIKTEPALTIAYISHK